MSLPATSFAHNEQPGPPAELRSGAAFRGLLYAVCVLTDFAVFVVVFSASRGMAERGVEPVALGMAGAGLSFSAAVGSILGGWLAHRFDGRGVFLAGVATLPASIIVCAACEVGGGWFLAGYWFLGLGLGWLYPPLIAWLNRGEDPHANRSGVSRRLILFCIAWNVGMMCGQLTAGSLFALGAEWAFRAALMIAVVNLVPAVGAVRRLESAAPLAPSDGGRAPESLERARVFKRLSWLANLGGMFGGSMVIHLLPDLVVGIGVSSDQHGRLLACWRLVIIATYLLMHVSNFWHFRLAPAVVSQLLGGVGLLVVARAEGAAAVLAGLALLGQLVGFNYFSGLYYSAAGSSHERRALAAGIHEATLAAGMAIGTVVGGAIGSLVNHRLPYLLAAAVVILLTIVQTIAWRRWKPKN